MGKEKMGEGMEGDWCVLYQLGWIDENGKENNETSTADLMSLKPGSCGAGRVSNGNLRSGESGNDRQDDGEEAQEVRQQVLGGGQSRADRDSSEDSRVQLFQGDVPLCLPEERQEPSLRFLPGTSNGGCFHRGFNNRCSSRHDYLVLSNLMQKINFRPSSRKKKKKNDHTKKKKKKKKKKS